MRLIDADALLDRIKNPYEQAQVARWVNEQPTIEPEKRTEKRTETHSCDLIERQAAIDAVDDVPYIKEHPNEGLLWKAWIEQMPSAQPDFDITVKIDKAYDDGYEVGYLQGRHDWGDWDE